uniref:ABC transporter ATP-binding protein n=1 Tax=Rhodovarius lipocyclicus TaxID=268410 RepID=UPI00135C2630
MDAPLRRQIRPALSYLRLSAIGKRHGAFQALRGVELSVAEGEFLCLLGPSGCGKTTLLRAIAGLDPPSEGRIEQAGRDITALPPAARDFGIVFQSYALFPNLTAAANITYGLRGGAWPRARRQARLEELLALVGLAEHAGKYPAQLSGGQQQRVAIARALAASPGLLLLDEPLAALDAVVRHRLRAEIRALQQRLRITTIMVTHDQEEALAVADRIAVMNQGRIEQLGSPEELYLRPATGFVAGFIGRASQFRAMVEAPGLLRLGGLSLRAAMDLPAGAAARGFIRPEDVLPDPQGMPARIRAIAFEGPVCRLQLALPELVLEAEWPPAAVAGLAPGAEIRIALPRVLAFADG